MSDIDDCRKSVERLTRDRGEVMRAGSDKIEEIRARHLYDDNWRDSQTMRFETWDPQTHDDRATLLAEVDRQRAENERLRADRRERIATAALQGILACQEGNTALPKEWPGIFAIMSVGCADALIAELDKEEGKP